DPAQVPLFPNLARVAPFKFPVAEEPEDSPVSRSPIIIAVEDAENPLQDGELLKTERHLTVSLGSAQLDALREIGKSLSGTDRSIASVCEHGRRVWQVFRQAQPRLANLLRPTCRAEGPAPSA